MILAWLFTGSQLLFVTIWQLVAFAEDRDPPGWLFLGEPGVWLMLATAGLSVLMGLLEGLTGRNDVRRWIVRLSGTFAWAAFQAPVVVHAELVRSTASPRSALELVAVGLLAFFALGTMSATLMLSPSWAALGLGYFCRTRLRAGRSLSRVSFCRGTHQAS